LFKYTIGASEDYNEISRLRKSLLENFPEAFIIAFRGGQKTDVRQAIQEFKSKKK
jgi:N-acetylmuramoyl-L-alanine amidase